MTPFIRRIMLTAGIAVLGTGAATLAAGDSLIVFEWSGYEDPLLNPAYLAKHPDGPEFSFFGDEDEAFEKLRAGFKADIAHPCSQNVVKWRDGSVCRADHRRVGVLSDP